jgi:hypothetical protein
MPVDAYLGVLQSTGALLTSYDSSIRHHLQVVCIRTSFQQCPFSTNPSRSGRLEQRQASNPRNNIQHQNSTEQPKRRNPLNPATCAYSLCAHLTPNDPSKAMSTLSLLSSGSQSNTIPVTRTSRRYSCAGPQSLEIHTLHAAT